MSGLIEDLSLKGYILKYGIRKLGITLFLFYIFPFVFNFITYRIVWDSYSCHTTSFFPKCDIMYGDLMTLALSMGFYYYIVPFPLLLPTVLSMIFLKITTKEPKK